MLVRVFDARRLAGGGTKHPLAGGRDCLTRLRVVNRHTCCLGTTNQTLVGQLRAPACRNKRVLPRFRCIMRPRRRGAREIGDSFQRRAWQSRNRTARSVWSASSLLALSEGGGWFESGSKLHALQTLRVAVHPPQFSQLANNVDYCERAAHGASCPPVRWALVRAGSTARERDQGVRLPSKVRNPACSK